MLNVPREHFVPDSRQDVAYAENNIDLAPGRVLLEPRTLGKMMDILDLQNSDLVLDIGPGYGYAAALMARIVEAVVAVEDNPELAAEAEARLAAQDVFNVAVVSGPLVGGCDSQGPYDAVLVEGAIEEFPETLTEQISEGGRVVAMFREGQLGVVRVGLKRDGRINWRFAFNAGAPVLPGFARQQGFVF